MRAFSDEEKTRIRQDLIRSYESCLNKYGLQKTSVDEIVELAGISKGSFYLFYQSKEALFVDVLDSVQERVVSAAYGVTPLSSTRQTMKEILRCIYREIKKTPWVLSLDSFEYERLLHRLPPELLERHMSRDSLDVAQVAEHFGIKFTVPVETATAVVRILLYPILAGDKIGPRVDEAVDLLISGAAEQAVVE
jgi:AcrR family transcriptional regulator